MPYKTLIEIEKLKEHFHEPMADAARKFGVCTTFFKRICRIYGIKRWPFRKLQSIEKKIHTLRLGEQSAQTQSKMAQLCATREQLQRTGVAEEGDLNVGDKHEGGLDFAQFVREPPPPAPADVHPLHCPPKTVENETGGLSLVLHRDDHVPQPPTELARPKSREEQPADPQSNLPDGNQASQILGGLARETLFRHTVATCSSNPEEHVECIRRFDSIQGGAVYIFEVGVTGDPVFKYISKGSYSVYGLTPEQVTHPDGCQSILGVIHDDDQASFLESVQTSRVNLTEWIWHGRSHVPSGGDQDVFEDAYKNIYARSVPEKLPDGTVRWEGFLMEVPTPPTC
eukprot:TRINITY_DN17447_c0_g1_i5.p1 TRINITY_DN17447_c0_g1~~TRINITY_DN17447_c0_g1_i5.p1  ORF type:complete len:341 (+),score=29.34 TRINITY_DN17447_c0_g1_i5:133-1155(+)